MDRQIVYIGQVPMDTDVLNTNINAYVGLSKLAAGILGTTTQLNGLACTQTASPSLAVLIGPGECYQLAAIDTSGYGSLPANSTQILKQGVNLGNTTTTTMAAPVTVGNSINYLIEFAVGQSDNGSQVLPYYDSANPSQAFTGPGNDGQPQMTNRANAVVYQIKAGTSAPTGTQVTPTPDAGYVGGYVVTIAQGQTTITNSNISVYPGAPFIPSTLGSAATQVGVQNGSYVYGADSSVSANTVTLPLSPAFTAYTAGQTVYAKIANTNTGASTININGLGAKNIQLTGGAALVGGELAVNRVAVMTYDGTQFELHSSATRALSNVADSGSVNAYAATLVPAPAAYVNGMSLILKIANTNTSTSCTLNLNSLGTKNILLSNGTNPDIGMIVAGMEAILVYDGTQFQLLNPANTATKTGIQTSAYIAVTDGGSANAYTATLSPALTAYAAGNYLIVKIANTNTSATCTLNVNSLGTKSIKLSNGANPDIGDLVAGMEAQFFYDGTNFQLLNPTIVIKQITKQIFTSGGTYTPTAGMQFCRIRMVGAGGGGGGANSASGQSSIGTGGGAGGYAERLFTAAQVGASATVTVSSSGGTAGSNGGSAGGNGGNTSIALTGTGTITMTANGGTGGLAGGSTASVNSLAGQAGGTTTNGDSGSFTGESGFSSFCLAAAALAVAGHGAGGPFGGGGSAGYNTGGGSATGFGAGGGGASSVGSAGNTAGAGSPGLVIIEEFCNQ